MAFCEVVTLTSRHSSSRDQLLAWATYCRVAVMYASGTNSPPRHTWMFCERKQLVRSEPYLLSSLEPGLCLAPQLLPQTQGSCQPPPGFSGAAVTTFSSLAPPDAAACEMFCSCLTLSLKSDTHWMTVMPAGTV